jgi:hypothetical protein
MANLIQAAKKEKLNPTRQGRLHATVACRAVVGSELLPSVAAASVAMDVAAELTTPYWTCSCNLWRCRSGRRLACGATRVARGRFRLGAGGRGSDG